jgi:hypothetical protein
MTLQEGLQVILGSQMSSIEFVQDYVQLRFDGPCLTAHTRPTVSASGTTFRWSEAGYRDVLCGRIAKKVVRADVSASAIAIGFEDGAEIQVSLSKADYRGPEAAMFTSNDGTWVI